MVARPTPASNDAARVRAVAAYGSMATSSFQEAFMPQYLIERNIPGAGKLTSAELKAISQKSCSVLNEMGPKIQWVHSHVTGDQIYCIYRAPNEAMVREHARLGGFPATRVSEITSTIDPSTAE